MYSDILSQVRTTSDLETLLEEISVLKSAIYDTKKESIENVLHTKLRSEIASIIRDKIASGESLEKYLEGLSKEVKLLSEVKIELAFDPTEETIEAICSWITKNVGESTIIDIDINPKLLGGAQISYNGKYFDGSLIKVVDLAMQQNEKAIIETIKSR